MRKQRRRSRGEEAEERKQRRGSRGEEAEEDEEGGGEDEKKERRWDRRKLYNLYIDGGEKKQSKQIPM